MVEEQSNETEAVSELDNPKSKAKPRTLQKREKRVVARKRTSKPSKKRDSDNGAGLKRGALAFPKHTILNCLRIPAGILDQNAGGECVDRDAAKFAKLGWSGEIAVEISSALKYGLLERPSPGKVRPTELARRILRPQAANDRIDGLRQAILNAPVISDFYKRYRGENLPEEQFLLNTAIDSFSVPKERAIDFIEVFVKSLKEAELLEDVAGGKQRVLDITESPSTSSSVVTEEIKKLSKGLSISASDTCFVMMPFADPLGGYYASIYKPAIEKAQLRAIRADAEIYGTGKIIDQIWNGIHTARILVAELTGRNPNVLYELGIAHALEKPVVLVSSNEEDVPFDIRHVRVIYYDMTDPFWGNKLIEKIAENILSALKNPAEAILFRAR
ncbi:TIR domain-containing protein [Edaphobacter bradus]|uniref:hypothetical protein n=1 Tax=Edaphobacter bradus TaxID=2259016 RepID=UPI0021DFFEFF|nr:hypothetical protein [Edaphobacter bradus]